MNKEIIELEEQIREAKVKLSSLRKKLEPVLINDYSFVTKEGECISLSEMFGDSNELMLIHNMGKSCTYCTLWADEYNGVTDHINNRVPFVVVSPDDSETMKQFAEGRNWKFNIYSSKSNSFNKDIGMEMDSGGTKPGVSTFIKDDSGQIFHKTSSGFGPGDNYCSVWDYFDLLTEGYGNWKPKYSYN